MTADRVEIDASDGAAALLLEHRLAHLAPICVFHDGAWLVELDGIVALDEIEAAVGRWLRETGQPSTTVHVRDGTVCIHAGPRAANPDAAAI